MGQVINSDGQEMLFESRCPLSVVFPVLCFETVRVRYSSMPSLGANEVMQGTFPRSAEFETSGISCRSASCHLHDTTESSRALLSRDLSECACSSILNAAFDILSCILHLQSDTTEIAKPQCCCQWTCERHPSTGLLGSRLSNESRQSAAAFYSIPQTRPRHCFTLVTFSIAPRQKWTIIYDYAVMTNLLFAFHVIIFLNYINAPRSNPNKNTPGENKYDTNETDREYTAETKEVGFPKHSSPRHSDDNITHVEGSETDTHSSSTVLAVDSISVRPVTLWPERKQEATCCHGISTRADESEEWTPTPSDDEEDILLKLKTLVLDEKTQSHNHGSIVSADFLRQSLQLLIQTTDEHESGQSGQKPHKKPNSDDGLDETDDDEFSFEDFYQASTMRFTPDGRNLIASCVARDMTAELARYGSFDVSRSESARQWLSRLQDAGGVWVLRLAQAGFYRPDENGTTLRCAFCSVEVPGDQMIGRQPMDVHKELSPSCPLITGRDTTNRSMGQFWQTGGQEYVQRFHEDPERQVVHCKPSEQPEHPKDGPGVGLHLQPERTESPSFTSASPTQNHEAQNSLSHPAANTPQLPGPVMLEPQSLPTAVNTDGHQSWAPSLQQIPEPVSLPAQSSSPPQQQATPHTFASHTARPEPITRSTSHQIPQPEPQAQTTESTAASDGQEVPAAQGHGQSTAPQGPQSSQPTPSESSPSENPPPSSDPPRQVVTYAQLGIFTQQPKRQDMVVGATRCNTFSGWPHAETHTPDEMSDAGFYYTGHGDLVRCFYCKGGLKSWVEHLRPWVEHARFFPECPYVSQVKGHLYVEVVKEMHEKQERVSEEEVERELEKRCRVPNQQQKEEKAEESGASWMEDEQLTG